MSRRRYPNEPYYERIVKLLFEVANVCPVEFSPDYGGNSMTIGWPKDHVHIGTPGDGPLADAAASLQATLATTSTPTGASGRRPRMPSWRGTARRGRSSDDEFDKCNTAAGAAS